jgi:hypothetical protein
MTDSDIATHLDRPIQSSNRALLFVSIGVWLLLGIGRALLAADESTGPGSQQVGAFFGALMATLLIALAVRTVVRAIRRRPLGSPFLTPALFFSAAVLNLLLLASAAGQESS